EVFGGRHVAFSNRVQRQRLVGRQSTFRDELLLPVLPLPHLDRPLAVFIWRDPDLPVDSCSRELNGLRTPSGQLRQQCWRLTMWTYYRPVVREQHGRLKPRAGSRSNQRCRQRGHKWAARLRGWIHLQLVLPVRLLSRNGDG